MTFKRKQSIEVKNFGPAGEFWEAAKITRPEPPFGDGQWYVIAWAVGGSNLCHASRLRAAS
jgi:hypothetical protein